MNSLELFVHEIDHINWARDVNPSDALVWDTNTTNGLLLLLLFLWWEHSDNFLFEVALKLSNPIFTPKGNIFLDITLHWFCCSIKRKQRRKKTRRQKMRRKRKKENREREGSGEVRFSLVQSNSDKTKFWCPHLMSEKETVFILEAQSQKGGNVFPEHPRKPFFTSHFPSGVSRLMMRTFISAPLLLRKHSASFESRGRFGRPQNIGTKIWALAKKGCRQLIFSPTFWFYFKKKSLLCNTNIYIPLDV